MTVQHALQNAATAPWVQTLALLCLCAAYLQGGIGKARNFAGAVAEVRSLGLAARFVSGYVYNPSRTEGRARLIPAGAARVT